MDKKIKILNTYQELLDKGKLGVIGKKRFRELLDKYSHYKVVQKQGYYVGEK